MSMRKKPTTLLQDQIKDLTYHVIEAEKTYTVMYKNEYFGLRKEKAIWSGFKYSKVSFNNQSAAHNLADKLNKLFTCDDFNVHVVETTKEVAVTQDILDNRIYNSGRKSKK